MGRKKKIPSQERHIEYAIMDAILLEIEKKKAERCSQNDSSCQSERSVSYGIAKEVINRHKRANPWLNRDVLNNYKRSKANISAIPKSITRRNMDSISDLTNLVEESEAVNEQEPSITEDINEPSTKVAKKGGRPKGSTNDNKRADKLKQMEAVNYAATKAFEYKEALTKDNDLKERVDKGAYDKIVREAEAKFSLAEGSIKKEPILGRLKSGRNS
jgi:hypothetical protein